MGNYINSAPMALVVVLLVVGFVFLVKGADFFVEGSSSVAKRFNVPSLIIGLTIVAMGTSLPETAVSVTASLVDNNALAVSNAVGSNIFNLMVVIGFCAVLTPVAVDKQTLKRDFPFSVLCAVILLVLGFIGMELGHVDGVVLLVLFAIYIVVLVRVTLKHKNHAGLELEEETEEIKLWLWKELENFPGLTLYGSSERREDKLPIFSFNIEGVHHSDLAALLDKMGVAVRSGMMCAEPLMAHFGVTGMVRVSLMAYNSRQEAEYFMECLRKAVAMLK